MATLPKCEGCRKTFTPLPSGSGDATPMLLRCGHTFCKTCLVKWVARKDKVACPKCEVVTSCQNGKDGVEQLWPNIYFAGVMACGSSRVASFSRYFEDIDCETGTKQPQKTEKLGPKCSECIKAGATCRCLQCRADMCSRCFTSVHAYSRLLQQHQSVSLRPSITNTECVRHRRLLEFFCEEDKSAICPECVISPEHKSHNVVRMVSKYEALKPQLKASQGMVNCALLHSTKVKSQVEAELHKVKNAAFQQAQLVNRYFLDHVGKLQAGFLGVIKELHNCAEFASSELFTIMEEIVAKEVAIKEAYDDADLILSDEAKSQVVVDPDKLLQVMQTCTSLPCNLITVKETIDNSKEEEYSGEFEFCFNPNPEIIRIQQMFGRMEIKTCLTHKLKMLAECPGMLDVVHQKEQHEKKTAKIRHVQEPYSRSQELVNVTYMDSPTAFRVQRFSDKSRIEGIDRCLKVFKTRKPLVDELFTTISTGELCAAFYEPSRCWYRARVVKKIGTCEYANDVLCDTGYTSFYDNHLEDAFGPSDMVEVYFIDYGDSAKTKVSCLRRLSEKLKAMPELGISCALNNVCPAEEKPWSEESIRYFSKVISDRPLLMTTVRREEGVRVVDLHRPAADEIDADVPMSIRDALVFLGFAKFQFNVPAPSQSQRITSKKFLTPSPLPSGSLVGVVVANLQSPEKFSVQLTDSNKDYFANLMQKIQVWVKRHTSGKNARAISNAVHNIQIICPEKGMVCLARFSRDSLWYRARIAYINFDQTVQVEYVDFGDVEVVHFLELLKIPEQFTRLPVQAIPCQIHGVSMLPGEDAFSDACCKRFAELCSHNELIMDVKLVKDCVYFVDLFDSTDEDPSLVSVTDRLYREGMLKFENFEAKLSLRTADFANSESRKNTDANGPSSQEPNDSSQRQKARVTEVTSPDLFHLQTEAQMSELNKMMLELQKAVENGHNGADDNGECHNWQENAMCVVRSSLEKRWCRGKVKSIEAEVCRVDLVDFGRQELVPACGMIKLPEQFTSVAGFLTRCTLGSVIPTGGSDKWTSTAVDRFKELISGEECLVEQLTENEGLVDVLPVDIWISEEQQGNLTLECTNCLKVSKMLELEGLALPVRTGIRRVPPAREEKSPKQSGNTTDGSPSIEPIRNASMCENLGSGDGRNDDLLSLNSSGDDASSRQGALDAEAPYNGRTPSKTKKGNSACQLSPVPTSLYSRVNALPVNQQFPCFVTHICDHSTFLLRKRPLDCGDDFDPVLQEIFEWNGMMKQVQDLDRCGVPEFDESKLVVGKPCLCMYVEDEQWHRGTILSIDELPNAVMVQYVDYGTIENVPLDRLRRIPETLLRLPLQAYLCQLEGVRVSSPDEEAKLEFAAVLQGKDLVAEIRGVSVAPPKCGHYRSVYVAKLFFVNEEGALQDVPKVVREDDPNVV